MKTDCYTCRPLLAFVCKWLKHIVSKGNGMQCQWPRWSSLTIRSRAWSLRTGYKWSPSSISPKAQDCWCRWVKHKAVQSCLIVVLQGATSGHEALIGTSNRHWQLCPFLPCSKDQWHEVGSQLLWHSEVRALQFACSKWLPQKPFALISILASNPTYPPRIFVLMSSTYPVRGCKDCFAVTSVHTFFNRTGWDREDYAKVASFVLCKQSNMSHKSHYELNCILYTKFNLCSNLV